MEKQECNIVISQSMYFPWIGLLEQIRLSQVFVHYDDVQYARGFYNRVQAKTSQGVRWLTVPLKNQHRGQKINEVEIDYRSDWKEKHRSILRQAYLKAPFREEMLTLFDEAMAVDYTSLADLSRTSIMILARYFGLTENRIFLKSEELDVEGSSSRRLRDISLSVNGEVYITGHGARNYLDHDLFERSGVSVRYMNYRLIPYPQLHGEFTPYVSALDLVANCGRYGEAMICSDAVDWKEFRK